MTAKKKYITSLLSIFSTFLESNNISNDLALLTTEKFVVFINMRKNSDKDWIENWSTKSLENFLTAQNIPHKSAVLMKKFVSQYTPLEIDVFLHEFLSSLKSNKRSNSTIKNYRSDIQHFSNFVKNKKIEQLFEPENLRAFVHQQIKAGLKVSTVKRKLSSISQFALWAENEKIVKDASFWISDIESLITGKNTINSRQPATYNTPITKSASKELEDFLLSLEIDKHSEATIKNYKSDISQFLDFAKTTDLKKAITQEQIKNFVISQKRLGLKVNSIKRKLSSISKFATWAESRNSLVGVSYWIHQLQTRLFETKKTESLSIKPSNNHKQQTKTPELKLKTNELVHAHQKNIHPPKVGWSLPVPDFATDSSTKKHQDQVITTDKNTKENQNVYSGIRTSLKDFANQINTKRNKQFLPYLNLVMLIVFVIGLGILGYQQFITQAPTPFAYPSTPTRPNRELSFQGRLTDTAQNPITSATNMAFRLYDNLTVGTQLWSSGTCSVTPDQDGIFNVGLGDSCGSEITEDVFTENSNVWLEVEIASETLTPRQSIKTVAYALNSETVQGYPVSATGAATVNTILTMDSGGQILLGEVSPTLKATTGTFSIEAQAISMETSSGSNGDINLTPDGTGTTSVLSDLDVTGYLTAPGATLSATYAGGTTLTVKGGPTGTANIQEWQNSAGTVLSVVDENGNIGAGQNNPSAKIHVADGGNLTLGSDGGGSNTITTYSASAGLYSQLNGNNLTFYRNGGSYISNSGGTSGSLVFRTQDSSTDVNRFLINGGDSNPDIDILNSTLDLNGNNIYSSSGNLNLDDTVYVSGNIGIGSITPGAALDIVGDIYLSSGLSTFGTAVSDGTIEATQFCTGDGETNCVTDFDAVTSLWTNTLNTYHPKNEYASIVDLVLGGTSTASADIQLFANGSATFNEQGADADFRVEGVGAANAFFVQGSDGNVGIGSSAPAADLDVFNGNIRANSLLASNGSGQNIAQYNGTNFLYGSSGALGDNLILQIQGEKLRIQSDGNVGIGTTTPTAKLHIISTAANPAKIVTSSTTNSSLLIGNTSTGESALHLDASNGDGAGSDYFSIRQNNDLTASIFTQASAGILSLGSKGTTNTLNIDAGNVGIGSTAPGYALDVVGEFNLTDAIRVAGDAGTNGYLLTSSAGGAMTWTDPSTLTGGTGLWTNTLNVLHASNEYASIVDLALGGTSTASANIHLQSSGQAYFAGNVGIGTSGPGEKLHIEGSGSTYAKISRTDTGNYAQLGITGSATRLYSRQNDSSAFPLYLTVGSLDALAIDTAGNVGIGSTSPGYELDVVGEFNLTDAIRVAGNAGTSGYLLTSSAGGANTWTDPDSVGLWGNTLNVFHPREEFASIVDLAIGGTSTASADIQLFANGSAVFNEQGNDADFRVEGISAANALFVQGSDGNVGIGTNSPNALLDVTGNTIIGNQTSINYAAGNSILMVNERTTDTSQAVYGIQGSLEVNPGAATSQNYYGGYFNTNSIAANINNYTGRLVGFQGQVDHYGTGTVTQARGFAGLVANQSTGTITTSYGGYFGNYNLSTGTITNSHGLAVVNGSNAGTMTSKTGITVEDITGATNNTNLLIGTSTIPTGDYGIYNSSTKDNYFAGNVGIGTTAPVSTLEVNGKLTVADGSTSSPSIVFKSQDNLGFFRSGTNNIAMAAGSQNRYHFNINYFSANPTGSFYMLQAAGDANTPNYAFKGDEDTGLALAGINELSLVTGGAEKVRIDTNGNVGIGSTTPASFKLEVAGDVGPSADLSYALGSPAKRWTNIYASGAISATGLWDADTDTGIQVEESADEDYIRFDTAGTERMLIKNDGNVGIGTSAPLGLLQVKGAATGKALVGLQEMGDQDILIASDSAGTTRFRMANTGYLYARRLVAITDSNYYVDPVDSTTSMAVLSNVGIGVAVPNNKLEIDNTYTDSTTRQGLSSTSTWSPSTTTGGVYPTNISSVSKYDSTHSPASGFLTSIRGWSEVADSGVLNINNVDLYSQNTSTAALSYMRDIWIRGAANSGGGSVTDYYGIYISDQTAATNNYGIYQLGSGVINYFAGNVGVGTSAPNANFHVEDTSDNEAEIRFGTTGASGLRFLTNNSSTREYIQAGASSGDTGAELRFSRMGTGTSNISEFDIYSDEVFVNGNVGIGTTSPNTNLELLNNSGAYTRYSSSALSAYEDMGGIEWYQTAGEPGIIAEIDVERGGGQYDQGSLRFYTNNGTSLTEKMIIDFNGNVGIGTTTPTALLHAYKVNSSGSGDYIGNLTDITQSSSGVMTAYAYRAIARATHTSGTLSGLQSNSTQAYFSGNGGTTSYGDVLSSGATIGTGATVSNLSMLKIFTPGNSGTIGALKGIEIQDMTGGGSNYAIYSAGGDSYHAGNIGIGSISPQYALDIGSSGDGKGIRFDGGDAFITTHDGFGNFNFLSGIDDDNVITSNAGGVRTEMSDSGALYHEIYSGSVGLTGTIVNTFGINSAYAYVDGGNFGIGDTTPDAALEVNGDALLSGNIYRNSHENGFLVGGYNNIGASSANTNPIFTIGSSYLPASTSLGGMYGIGYTYSGASFIPATPGGVGWGMYVASGGVARIFLNGNTGGAYFASNVGIGITSPSSALDVSGDIELSGAIIGTGHILKPKDTAAANIILNKYNATGSFYFRNTTTIGGQSPYNDLMVLDNNGNLFVGPAASSTTFIKFSHAWSDSAQANSSEISNDRGTYKTLMVIGNKSGNGTTRKVAVWDHFTVNGTFVNNSDIRLKENIVQVEDSLEKLTQLNGYAFTWKKTGGNDMGVIAQELEKIYPTLVEESGADLDTGQKYKSVHYLGLFAPVIESIKELKVRNETLKLQVDSTINIATDSGQIILEKKPDNTYKATIVESNTPITRIGAFANLIVASIRSGLVNTKDLIVQNTASIKNLSVESFTINGQTLASYIQSVVNGQVASNGSTLISPVGNDTIIKTASESGQIAFTNSNNQKVATISAQGNLSILGNLVADRVVTNSITTTGSSTLGSLLVNTDATISGKLAVNTLNAQSSTLGSLIANQATISGSLTVAQDATVSGTLVANQIEAASSRIALLEAGMAELEHVKATTANIVNATVSGTLYANNIYANSIYDFEETLATTLQQPSLLDIITGVNQSTTSETEMANLYDTINKSEFSASSSADLNLTLAELNMTTNDVTLTGTALFVEKYLKVNGAGYVSDSLAVGNSLFVGKSTQIADGLIRYSTTDPDNQILKIQPEGQGSIELLAGIVTIDDSGKVTVNGDFDVTGNAKIAGTLLTNQLKPTNFGNPLQVQVAGVDTQTNEVKKSRFEIINEVGTPVATFSAEGNAEFAGSVDIKGDIGVKGNVDIGGELKVKSQDLGSSDTNELTADKTSGKATIKSGSDKVTIKSNLINNDSLVYVTAVGSTGNQVLYVKSQTQDDTNTPENEGEFVVGFDSSATSDISFNWWIVN